MKTEKSISSVNLHAKVESRPGTSDQFAPVSASLSLAQAIWHPDQGCRGNGISIPTIPMGMEFHSHTLPTVGMKVILSHFHRMAVKVNAIYPITQSNGVIPQQLVDRFSRRRDAIPAYFGLILPSAGTPKTFYFLSTNFLPN